MNENPISRIKIKTIVISLFLFLISIKTFFAADDCINFSPLQLNVLVDEVIRQNPNLDATRFRIQAAHEVVSAALIA